MLPVRLISSVLLLLASNAAAFSIKSELPLKIEGQNQERKGLNVGSGIDLRTEFTIEGVFNKDEQAKYHLPNGDVVCQLGAAKGAHDVDIAVGRGFKYIWGFCESYHGDKKFANQVAGLSPSGNPCKPMPFC